MKNRLREFAVSPTPAPSQGTVSNLPQGPKLEANSMQSICRGCRPSPAAAPPRQEEERAPHLHPEKGLRGLRGRCRLQGASSPPREGGALALFTAGLTERCQPARELKHILLERNERIKHRAGDRSRHTEQGDKWSSWAQVTDRTGGSS